MKNKFKKSKIIVPALALITTTTVASVTGTVAWFSANRAATVTGNFQAVDAEGSLQVTTTAGVGTTSATTTTTFGSTSAVVVDGVLTHGSYNADTDGTTEGNLYVADLSEPTTSNPNYTITGYTSKGSIAGNAGDAVLGTTNPWLAGTTTVSKTTKNVWYGVSWTVNLKLTSAGNESATKMAFIDFNKTTIADADGVNKGFRVAVMDGTHTYIIGGDSTVDHVTGTGVTNHSDWTTTSTSAYHQFGETYTRLGDNVSKGTCETLANGYLFELEGTTVASLTCVAWYEGQDANVVSSQTSFNPTDLTLTFYSRQTIVA